MTRSGRKLKLIAPPTLCYDEAIWSPDGNYIAYIQGGDIGGNPFYLIGSDCIPLPLGLTVCNWRTGEEHWVVDNDTLKNSFAWSAPHTLFYGVMPQGHQELLRNYWDSKLQTDWQKQQNPIAPFDLKAVSAARPDIYVYSIESKQSKLLIRDGYRPLPSPDGKKIAFFGSEAAIRNYPLNQGWQRAPGYSSLMIANRDGTGRVALDRPKTAYPLLLWEADNAHLLALKEPNNQAQLDEWDVTSQQFRNILMLQAQDYEVLKRRHHFTMLSTSHDGNTLFVFQKEVTGVTGSLYDTRGALQSVDLRNGTFKTLFQTKNDSGLDWHDESAPTLAALTTP